MREEWAGRKGPWSGSLATGAIGQSMAHDQVCELSRDRRQVTGADAQS